MGQRSQKGSKRFQDRAGEKIRVFRTRGGDRSFKMLDFGDQKSFPSGLDDCPLPGSDPYAVSVWRLRRIGGEGWKFKLCQVDIVAIIVETCRECWG